MEYVCVTYISTGYHEKKIKTSLFHKLDIQSKPLSAAGRICFFDASQSTFQLQGGFL